MTKRKMSYASWIFRVNIYKHMLLQLVLAISDWPSAILEPFLRKNQGERKFQLSLCITLAILMAIFPVGIAPWGESFSDVVIHNITWYAFIAAYLLVSFKRFHEIKRLPGVFDLKKYSRYDGDINPWFYKIDVLGIRPNSRIISQCYEPAVTAAIGLLLVILGQRVGFLIIGCSVLYTTGWVARFYKGDQFIMDKIDEMILNEELVNSFVGDKPASETRGFEIHGRKPRNPDFRRKVADSMLDEEPAADVL